MFESDYLIISSFLIYGCPVDYCNDQIKEIFENLESVKNSIENGSVITVDAGIIALSNIAACGEKITVYFFHSF